MKRTEHTQKWLDALRSGEYEQGRGRLYSCGKYCCMGVAANVFGHFAPGGNQEAGYTGAREKIGMSESEMWKLIGLNDGLDGIYPQTFHEIADEIEHRMLEPDECQ